MVGYVTVKSRGKQGDIMTWEEHYLDGSLPGSCLKGGGPGRGRGAHKGDRTEGREEVRNVDNVASPFPFPAPT